jgi:hypothetical protein
MCLVMDVRCNNIHSNMVFVNKHKINVRVRIVTFQNTQIFTNLGIFQPIGCLSVW